MKVIVSAGGTGGHIYPALAVINKLRMRNKEIEILYIGTTDRMEKDIIPSMNIRYVGIEMKGINRKNIFKNIKVYKIFKEGIKKCLQVMREFKPDVVICFGGYITAPVLISAKKLHIKTFMHEQNSIPGFVNKFYKKKATVIGISMKDSEKYFKGCNVVLTGNPRSEEAYFSKPVIKSKYGLSENKKLVLFVMGSLGSMTITNTMKDILPSFKDKNYEVLYVTGNNYYDSYSDIKLPNNVKLVKSLKDMLNVLQKCDLIITRAGATTIAEITAIGIPSIMIPSPYVTHNHQVKNALSMEKNGACTIVYENDLTKEKLVNVVDSLINDDKKLNEMRKNTKRLGVIDSATKIAEIVEKLGENND